MQKENLLKMLKEYIKYDTSILPDLLQTISESWDELERARNQQRNSDHRHALQEMLDNLWSIHLYRKKKPRLFTNLECCTLLEAIDAVIPSCVGGSDAQRQLLAHVAASAKALGWTPEDEFISKIRNKSQLLANLYRNNGN